MKTNYLTKKLGNVVDLITKGTTPKTYGHDFTTSGVPFLRAEDIKDSIDINLITHHISEETNNFLNRSKTKQGDVLLTIAGTIGRTAVITEKMPEMNMNQAIAIVRPKKELDPYFLSLFFRSDISQNQIIEGTVGMAIPNFSLTMIKNLEIPLPPLETQKEIVAKLDEKFAKLREAKRLREEALADTEKILSQTLREIFEEGKQKGWEESTLEDVAKFIDYRGKTPNKTTDGMRLITAKNVKWGFLNIEPREYVNDSIYDSWMTRGIPVKGDVLFTTEAPLANVAQLDTDEKVVFAQRIIILQPDQKILSQDFLKYTLMAGPIRNIIIEQGTGATVKGIKASKLKKVIIPLPPLAEQQKIVKRLDDLSSKLRTLRDLQTSQLADLKKLEKSYLREAFRGELA